MLREYGDNSDPSRRWFGDDYFDLIVWYGEGTGITGFQLCYNRGIDEHALTWSDGGTMSHHRIDSGEEDPTRNMTPILVPDGVVPYQHLVQQFQERSRDLEPSIVALILHQLQRAAGNR